jgi:hypothetical protein
MAKGKLRWSDDRMRKCLKQGSCCGSIVIFSADEGEEGTYILVNTVERGGRTHSPGLSVMLSSYGWSFYCLDTPYVPPGFKEELRKSYSVLDLLSLDFTRRHLILQKKKKKKKKL